jgi:hypothetical protein
VLRIRRPLRNGELTTSWNVGWGGSVGGVDTDGGSGRRCLGSSA